MEKEYYYLVNSKILPSVYGGVLKAKELLAEGKAPNTSKAVKMAGISRSAFYKYMTVMIKIPLIFLPSFRTRQAFFRL